MTALFRSLPLATLRLTTSDPFTNRAVFESTRDLVCTQKRFMFFIWIVTVNIDDQGHCYVPLSLATFTNTAASGTVSVENFVKKYLAPLSTTASTTTPNQQYYGGKVSTSLASTSGERGGTITSMNTSTTSNINSTSTNSTEAPEDTYHIMEDENGEPELILVELSTLTDLLNRDVNLNTFPANEPKLSVRIIPQ